ncbi:MAG: hypothetical protein A2V66_05520 [Ignavibacteria bacterium RBG_13_36_8]|nr:MAG: hypothetical protein A2V66_05520 [Ignavibacteria bacterium RBG_13_36_8]
MNCDHPADETLQQFIDNKTIAHREIINRHLKTCGECSIRAEIYKIINEQLSIEPGENFSPEFENCILKKIKNVKVKNAVNKPLITTAVILFFGLILYLMIFPEIREILGISFHFTFKKISQMYNYLFQQHRYIFDSLAIIIFSLIIMIGFGLPNWRKIINKLPTSKP